MKVRLSPRKLELPYPPSANHYWRRSGKIIHVSSEGKKFRKRVRGIIKLLNLPLLLCRLAVVIHCYPPDNRERDIDNIQKPLLDALQHAGVYKKDSQVDDLRTIRKEVANGGKVVVFVKPLIESIKHPTKRERNAGAKQKGRRGDFDW